MFMDGDELQKMMGQLRFGDAEQIRIKNLLGEADVAQAPDRLDVWLTDALLRVGGCPPETLLRWAQGLTPHGRQEARHKVAALRELVLAMDVFLEKAAPDPPTGR